MKFNWRNALYNFSFMLGFYGLLTAYILVGIFLSPYIFVVGGISLLIWSAYQAGRHP